MDKVVIFDWGGIVESHENNLQDLNEAKIRLIKRFNHVLPDEEILKRWTDKTSKGKKVGTTNNKKDIEDWVNLLQNNMNINVPFAEFKKSYEEEFDLVKYYKEVAKYAHSLKNRCKIAILSNLGPFDRIRIDKQYDLSEFDYVYLSFEIGLRKPDIRIYQYVLKDMKISPENILFVDDDTNNILMAKECGWNICQAFGYELDKIEYSVEEFLK